MNISWHSFNPWQRRAFVFFSALLFTLILSAGSKEFPRPMTTAEKAARVDTIFKSLRENPPEGITPPKNQQIRITEDELNAYLDAEYRGKSHIGMKTAKVNLFDESRVSADSVINVDEIKTEGSMALKLVTLFFSGEQTVHAEAKMIFNGNTVFYQIERAQLNGVTLPNAVVEKLIEILARKQNQKVDVTKPIPLTPAIKHVEIRKGLLIIQT
jgi:hypothetical protein